MRRIITSLSFCVLVLSVVRRCAVLSAQNFPASIDGFYYLQEFQYWQLGWNGYYGGGTIFFAFIRILFGWVRENPFDQFRLAVLLCLTLQSCVLGLGYWLGEGTAKHKARVDVCLLLLALPWLSPTQYYSAYHFPRLALAVSLALIAAALLNYGRSRPVSSALGVMVLLLAVLCHKAVLVLVAIHELFRAMFGSQRDRKTLLRILCSVLIVAGALICNFGLVRQSISFLTPPFPFSSFTLHVLGRGSQIEFIAVVFLILVSAHALIIEKRSQFFGLFFLFLICEGPWWKPIDDLIWFRLGLVGFGIAAACIALVLSRTDSYRENTILLIVLAATGVGTAFPSPVPARTLAVPVLLRAQTLLSGALPQGAFIKAPHGLQFAVTYLFGRRSAQTWPGRAVYSDYFELLYAPTAPIGCLQVELLKSESELKPDCLILDAGWVLTRYNNPKV